MTADTPVSKQTNRPYAASQMRWRTEHTCEYSEYPRDYRDCEFSEYRRDDRDCEYSEQRRDSWDREYSEHRRDYRDREYSEGGKTWTMHVVATSTTPRLLSRMLSRTCEYSEYPLQYP